MKKEGDTGENGKEWEDVEKTLPPPPLCLSQILQPDCLISFAARLNT